MPIAIGLDFGSLTYRAVYLRDNSIVPVPMPPDASAWRGLIFMEAEPNLPPLGLTFTSLKYQLGDGTPFAWRGAQQTPEAVLHEILADIKRNTEIYAGDVIDRTVIAVPARYAARRRSTLREVAQEAGLGKVDLINDCTAAALGYAHGQDDRPWTLLLYSMGFIGYEISLVRYARQRWRELVHEGGAAPSGRDFNLQVMAGAISAVRHAGMDLPYRAFSGQWFDFHHLASNLKEDLSIAEEGMLYLPPYITGNETLPVKFQSSRLAEVIRPQVAVTIDVVKQALEDAGLSPIDVDRVVLVGGSTRVPEVQRQLEDLFGDKLEPPRDDLIARGAALQAQKLAEAAPGASESSVSMVVEIQPSQSDQPVTQSPPSGLLPPKPDVDALLAYARELAAAGRVDRALEFLADLSRQTQALQEQLHAS
jgi:molecular chaperone DnaK (HSP70)